MRGGEGYQAGGGGQAGIGSRARTCLLTGLPPARSRRSWLLFDRLKPEGGDIWLLEQSRAAN